MAAMPSTERRPVAITLRLTSETEAKESRKGITTWGGQPGMSFNRSIQCCDPLSRVITITFFRSNESGGKEGVWSEERICSASLSLKKRISGTRVPPSTERNTQKGVLSTTFVSGGVAVYQTASAMERGRPLTKVPRMAQKVENPTARNIAARTP